MLVTPSQTLCTYKSYLQPPGATRGFLRLQYCTTQNTVQATTLKVRVAERKYVATLLVLSFGEGDGIDLAGTGLHRIAMSPWLADPSWPYLSGQMNMAACLAAIHVIFLGASAGAGALAAPLSVLPLVPFCAKLAGAVTAAIGALFEVDSTSRALARCSSAGAPTTTTLPLGAVVWLPSALSALCTSVAVGPGACAGGALLRPLKASRTLGDVKLSSNSQPFGSSSFSS